MAAVERTSSAKGKRASSLRETAAVDAPEPPSKAARRDEADSAPVAARAKGKHGGPRAGAGRKSRAWHEAQLRLAAGDQADEDEAAHEEPEPPSLHDRLHQPATEGRSGKYLYAPPMTRSQKSQLSHASSTAPSSTSSTAASAAGADSAAPATPAPAPQPDPVRDLHRRMREAGARVAASFGEGDIVDDDDLPVHDVPLASSAAQIDAELAGDLDDDLESPGDVELDDEAAREGLAEYEPEPDEMDLPPSPSPTPDAPPAKPKRKRVVDTPQQRFMQHLYDLYGKAGKTLAYYQRHDTFWVRRPEPMMAMRKPTHIDWEPACLYDVGLWDAEALCQYYCPGRTQRFRCPRNPAHEMARAPPSKPYGRRCLEERRDYYLFGWRRRCEHCYKESGHYTSCSDFSDHIMRQLPEIVQLLFPAILTARAAIDKGLITLICKGAAGGFGPTRIAAYLCERATLEHAHLEEAYLTLWLLRKVESTSAAGRAPTSFPSFDDRKTYNGVRTTAGYIVAVWLAWMDAHKVYIDRFIAAASGRVLKADHHMKIVKFIKKIGGARVFVALYTVLNEYGQIRGMWLTETKTLDELVPRIEELLVGLAEHGHPQPFAWYTDNARAERPLLESIAPSLIRNVRHVDPSQWSQLDALVRTDKMNMGAVTDPGEAQRELARLVACQAELGTGVITGLDTEWWVERTSAGGFAVGHDPDRLDVVQIAVEDPRRKGRFCILVIQVTDWTADDWAQQHALRRIIISSVFIKAGVRVTQDIRRIAVYLGLSADESEQAISPDGIYELVDLAWFTGVIAARRRVGLADLTALVLNRYMSKADRLRNWSEPLSKSAIDYAGLDAYASLAICLALLKRKIVGEALTEADLGARVYLQQGKSRPFSGVVASALGELGDITDFSVDAHASRRRFEAAPSELVVQVLEVHTPAFLMRKHGMTLGALRDQAGRDDDGTWRPFYVVVALNELVYRPELHPAQIVASLAERQHERTAPQLFRLERPDAFVLDASALDTATGVGADEQDGEDGQQDDDDDDDNDDDDGVAGNGDELEDLGQLALDDSDAEDSDDDRMPEDDL